jgi:hypothetical protein
MDNSHTFNRDLAFLLLLFLYFCMGWAAFCLKENFSSFCIQGLATHTHTHGRTHDFSNHPYR